MNEKEFFQHLEFCVCRELADMRDPALRPYWCDGFIPDSFAVSAGRCRIMGDVWICKGSEQSSWRFAVLLGGTTLIRENVNWAELIPGEDKTGWLSMDFKTSFVKIDPLGARLDPPGPEVLATHHE